MVNNFDELIHSLQCLPNIGKKSAQRIAFGLLSHNRNAAHKLAQSINSALDNLKHCKKCQNFSQTELCDICANENRNPSLLCIVESPMDLLAIEQTCNFDGLYFVLMGAISPVEGIGANEIGLDKLRERISKSDIPIREILLATNFTNEGETTAYAISQMADDKNINITRLAHGVPVGGELEYLDIGTIAQALIYRKKY